MPAVLPFPIKTLLSQFNKRDHIQNQGENDSDVKSLVAIVGLVIAALTLLVAMIVPIFRWRRFRHWVSSFSILSFFKFYDPKQKALGIIPLLNLPKTTPATEDLSTIPATEIPIPRPTPICNGNPNTSPHSHDPSTREDSRVPQVEESPRQRRLQPAVTWPVSER